MSGDPRSTRASIGVVVVVLVVVVVGRGTGVQLEAAVPSHDGLLAHCYCGCIPMETGVIFCVW